MVKKFVYGTPFETEAVVKEIPSSEGNPDYGTFSTENGFSFTTKLADDDMVFGLGEANRGINKRGFLYISDCADDPNHVESKTSLYAAHNFIIISGKTHVGFFFDYPGTLRFDIGYTTSDTMTVSCENADLYVYMITGDSDLDIVKQFRGIIGRSYIAPKFAFGYGQSRWGYKTEDDFRTVVKKYRENHVPLDMVYMDIDYMQDYKDFTVNDENKLILINEGEHDGDENKFNIKRGANYRIKLNLSTLDIEFTNLDGEEPDNSEFWMIGTAAGDTPIAMSKDVSNPDVFTYNGELQDGTFRISRDKEGIEAVTEEKQTYQSKYAITFDAGSQDFAMEQIVVYEKVWAMGQAISGDFAWDKVKELTQSSSNKNEFVYEGELGTGQIKFPLQFGDYNGLFFVPEVDNKGVYDEFMDSCYLRSEKGDNKWYMNNPGIFKITINTYKKEIHFQKQ